jgi:NRAMP (natural resistance-associated macrophage protein)-like metal ion transporter
VENAAGLTLPLVFNQFSPDLWVRSVVCCSPDVQGETLNLSALYSPLFRKGWRRRVMLALAVIGPGFITANVDNHAGGIYTYSQAGAQFGYSLLWTMIPITVALVVVQEMASRMGAVTGKGLSDLIREEFGLRATFLLMVALVITNFGNVMAEFAGVVSSLELFGVSKYITNSRGFNVVAWATVIVTIALTVAMALTQR